MSWKKVIKHSKLESLVPNPDGSWSLPHDIMDAFVHKFASTPHVHSGEMTDDEAWFNLIFKHNLGIKILNEINLDQPNLGTTLHSFMKH